MTDPAPYRWIIDKDHLQPHPPGAKTARGTAGPFNQDPAITANATRFSMYDDDDECYYEGRIFGDFDGFEPLDDFGMPNAGCTKIKINGAWV
jgi:hypothetical protein